MDLYPYHAQQPDPIRRARIEIIPLIDVIFFLLATFVLFTLSLNKILCLPTDLPGAADLRKIDVQPLPPVVIQVSDSGSCYWDGEPLSHPEVVVRLKAYAAQQGKAARVLIAGDNLARFGAATRVLDAVRGAGIEQVAVETRVRPTGK